MIQHLFIYPVKSLGGIEVKLSVVEKRGLQFDRRYMLVDPEGKFLTQRSFPAMAALRTSFAETGFCIRPDHTDAFLEIPFEVKSADTMGVEVWNDRLEGLVVSDAADAFFSKHLHRPCRLIYMPDDAERAVDRNYGAEGDITSFSDGYPILLIGSASLDDLNERLEEKLGWDRFRPNVVVKTSTPFEEDRWRHFSSGESQFNLVKPCARCVMTTINQQTTVAGKEPLRTLSTYRTVGSKVMFGMNVIPASTGTTIRTGDAIQVVA